MNSEFEKYFLGTLALGIFISYLFLKTPNIIYKGGSDSSFVTEYNSKCYNQDSEEIKIIQERKKPNWLPPQPFLNIGIYSKLFYERIRASSEI